ncbi:hypothetical protein BK659_18785 [Pseudomonas brassicacearum]|uniref:Uncharacterized protein n=1 Tax=Pseudomonas brassicacearum TaxID=930166 RepID=A0A423H3M3_9PSED|nr:hypothetical protein [Pseudomonas brassicacearum]RON07328.1 hypothetical protein BK659_18785 [Pseudomonas brassicacearum]
MSENNASQLEVIINASGSCKGNLGPLGSLVPDGISMVERSGLLIFEASTGSPAVRRQTVVFELPGNIQSGSHDQWARWFAIYVYDGEQVKSWRGLEGAIDLVINSSKQEFSASLKYTVGAPDQSEFEVTVDLSISGFNKLITPS